MGERVAIVLQARMGSARFPGKSMALIEGRTMLARCVDRLRARSGLAVVLATTAESADDVLVSEAAALNVPAVRGSVDDVLSRYVLAATTFELTHVVRATADNPVVDLFAPLRALNLLRRTGAGYVVEHGLPYGCAVEAVSAAALRYADTVATEAYDREHVTPLMRRDRRFVSLDSLAPATVRRPDLRLTVDTPDDLDHVRRIYAVVGRHDDQPPLETFIAAADHLARVEPGESGAGVR